MHDDALGLNKKYMRQFNTYEISDHFKQFFQNNDMVSPLEGAIGAQNQQNSVKRIQMITSKVSIKSPRLIDQQSYTRKLYNKLNIEFKEEME